jgi:hypothetical protein
MSIFVQHGFPWEMTPWVALAFAPLAAVLIGRRIARRLLAVR